MQETLSSGFLMIRYHKQNYLTNSINILRHLIHSANSLAKTLHKFTRVGPVITILVI